LSEQVLRLFIAAEEISDADLTKIYAPPPLRLLWTQITPSRQGWISVYCGFSRPNFCFKDLGMQAVINLLSLCLATPAKDCLLVSTGDTGPAALQAVSDVDNPLLTILVHYPDGQI
jgi:threonine synthase